MAYYDKLALAFIGAMLCVSAWGFWQLHKMNIVIDRLTED